MLWERAFSRDESKRVRERFSTNTFKEFSPAFFIAPTKFICTRLVATRLDRKYFYCPSLTNIRSLSPQPDQFLLIKHVKEEEINFNVYIFSQHNIIIVMM